MFAEETSLSAAPCECGCGQASAQSFPRGHDSEALRMLLHLEDVLLHDPPIVNDHWKALDSAQLVDHNM